MALHELSERVGILGEYFDVGGRRCSTSDDTRRAILHALKIDASTDDAAQRALDVIRQEEASRLFAPVRVVELGKPLRLDVRTPGDRDRAGPWSLSLDIEGGRRWHSDGPWRGGA